MDIGAKKGKYYAVNFPLRDGIDDESFESIFNPIVGKVLETYEPSAVVLQCGADSLTGDPLGGFNLTLKGTFFEGKRADQFKMAVEIRWTHWMRRHEFPLV